MTKHRGKTPEEECSRKAGLPKQGGQVCHQLDENTPDQNQPKMKNQQQTRKKNRIRTVGVRLRPLLSRFPTYHCGGNRFPGGGSHESLISLMSRLQNRSPEGSGHCRRANKHYTVCVCVGGGMARIVLRGEHTPVHRNDFSHPGDFLSPVDLGRFPGIFHRSRDDGTLFQKIRNTVKTPTQGEPDTHPGDPAGLGMVLACSV